MGTAVAPLIDMPENLPSISGIPDCRVTGRISGVSTKDEGTPWRPGRLQWIADTTPGVTAIPCECRWLRRGGPRARLHGPGGGGGHPTAPGAWRASAGARGARGGGGRAAARPAGPRGVGRPPLGAGSMTVDSEATRSPAMHRDDA